MATEQEDKNIVEKSIEKYSIEDEDVKDFLDIIYESAKGFKNDRDLKNELITVLFDEGFEVRDPKGTKKVGSKVLQQALWRSMARIKFLDFQVHGTGRSGSAERLTAEGIRSVADRGNLIQCFRDKGGVFQKAFLFSDGFLMLGKGSNEESPVYYKALDNENVYMDNHARGIRGTRPAYKVVVIEEFAKDEAWGLFPELEENNIFGRIPGGFGDDDTGIGQDDTLEMAYGYNIVTKKFVQFAGSQCHVMEKLAGEKEYPFIKRKKPYVPVFQFMCQPGIEGPYNHGIGDMLYELAILTRKLLNMEVGHLEENVYPITFISAPQTKVDELVEKMATANEARKLGGKPFVAMEFDPNGGQQSVVAQSLLTQNLFQEWQIVWDRLYNEISRLGINLDDVDRGTGYTAEQIRAEEETAGMFYRQMMEYNASETKELMECTVDAITEFVRKNNETPLDLTTRIKIGDKIIGANEMFGIMGMPDKTFTMGMLSEELRQNNYFIIVNSRTGRIPSDTMRLLELQRQLSITTPGSPQWSELYRQMAQINGLDFDGEGQTGGQPNPVVREIPTETAPENVAELAVQ